MKEPDQRRRPSNTAQDLERIVERRHAHRRGRALSDVMIRLGHALRVALSWQLLGDVVGDHVGEPGHEYPSEPAERSRPLDCMVTTTENPAQARSQGRDVRHAT